MVQFKESNLKLLLTERPRLQAGSLLGRRPGEGPREAQVTILQCKAEPSFAVVHEDLGLPRKRVKWGSVLK